MPRMDNPTPATGLVKLLLIGDGKGGKSHYASVAANAGFNVLYFAADDGAATLTSLVTNGTVKPEAAKRIYLMDTADTVMSGKRDSKFVQTVSSFIGSVRFRWNDDLQRVATPKDTGNIWEIQPAKMGFNDLLVFDSWTAYVESVMLWVGIANGVNVADASTSEMRPVYQGAALKATEMLQTIRSLRCHVIVIAHPDEFQHVTLKEGVVKGKANEKDQIVDWTKMIPKTTSKPQGLQMAKYFTDVAWMELSPAGNERRLNFKPKNDRVGGGHFTDLKSVDEYSFANLVKFISGRLPDGSEPEWINMMQIDSANPPAASGQVLDGTKPASVGFAGFMSGSK